MNLRTILVTGANTGIGLALSKQLLMDHDCRVIMACRSVEKGEKAIDSLNELTTGDPPLASKIDLVEMDVASDSSVSAAAELIKNKGVKLYALVNNAGVGFNTGPDSKDSLLNTNFYGPKRVTEAFLECIDPEKGRIVNVSSGAASMWLRNQSEETKSLFSSPETTWEELNSAVQSLKDSASMGAYGLSKAGVTAYTLMQSKDYPNLICTSLSPGFIETAMTSGFGATLTPEQGTVSLLRCLFGEVTSGFYYGSDGLRSPITVTRDPGTPEYEGEENPDPSRYNK